MSKFDRWSILDALDVGIIVVDEQRCIVGWNDWIARVTATSKSAALGKSLYDVFPTLRNTRLPAAIDDSFQVGSSSILNHSLNTLLPLRGEGGQELLHNIIVRPASSGQCLLQINDVTVSVTRERVLRERQSARYHAIVDSAPDAIVTTGLDGKIQWVNVTAEQSFGYTPAELLGQPIDILLQQAGSLSQAFDQDAVLTQAPARPIQVLGRRKHGQSAQFDVSFAAWAADDRIFVTTIWRDVTERMAAEAALRESEERHRALSEALPQLVWICQSNGSFDYFNPQWHSYTGVAADKHDGSGWLNVIHETDRAGLEAAWKASLATGAVFDFDARLRRADGVYRWFKMRAIPIRSVTGRIARWFGTATDIADLVDARDSLLRSNEELEALVVERTREREVVLRQLHESQKMESIGRLTGGLAHDFNNLLSVILGGLNLLKKRVPSDPHTTRLMDGAIQGAERGATLTKRLLAFARRQDLKLEAVELQELVPNLSDFLRQSVGPGIAIVFDIQPDARPVKIDANQLELALINLAVNARDAMPDSGTLTISCHNEIAYGRNHAPSSLPSGDFVRVSVSDTGVGMTEATLAKALEPFFTTKGVGKGTGLGLSMVHGFTAQSGGAMTLASQVGKGTEVRLWLPCAGDGDLVSVASERKPVRIRRESMRILLVDDDALVRTSTADMLTDLGHVVLEEPSGADALRVLASDSEIDVVVTDFAMPEMNGFDLATKIRQMNGDMPIILATGYAELPIDATINFPRLAKPYTQEQLAEALNTVVNTADAAK